MESNHEYVFQSSILCKSLKVLLFAAAAASFAPGLQATMYYWKGPTGSSSYGDWSNLSNWSTEGTGGADAAAAPGSTNTFYGLENRSIDLQGQEWSIGGWSSTGDWNRHNMYLRNGTLNVVGDVTTHSDDIHLNDAKIVFAAGTTFTPAESDAGEHRHYIHSGGEVDIFGNLRIYKYHLYIESGGTAVVNPSQFNIRSNTGQTSYFQNDGGTLSLPSGMVFQSGSTSSAFCFSLIQNSGTLELGGPVSKGAFPGDFRIILAGGTVSTTGNVSFDFSSATVPDNANLTLDIAEGSSCSLSAFTFGQDTSVTKTGSGDYPFASGDPLPDSFTVSEGAVLLSAPGSYDLSGIVFGGNGQVKIGAAGITLTDWDPSLAMSGGFVADIASPVNGSTLLTCDNASILDLARTGLNATLPEGFAVAIEGNSLVVSSSYVFNSTTVTDLNNPAGWVGGSVPVGKVVTIMGAGVAPTTTALPAFAGITVMDGASLTVANGGTLPAVTLSDSASLTLASGDFTLAGALSPQPSSGNVPAITVASGATLYVPGGTTFSDCSLNVGGELAVTSAGGLNLGYAAAGETSSFGLAVTGVISNGESTVNFFCPASGGTVVPLGDIVFAGASFKHTNDCGFNFCVNNPTSQAMNFVFDGTTLNYPKRGYYTISGGAALSFANGGSLWRDNNQNEKFTLTVSGLASIFLGEGTSSLIGESSNSGGSVGNGFMSFSPDTDGFVSLVVSNATWETYHSAGNGKAVAEIYGNSVHTINQHNYNRVQPFDGFKEVHLNDGALLTISNNVDAASMSFAETFTGSGSLMFSTPRSTTRTFNFNSTASTATGTLSADPAKNDALIVASTATWGGTLVWNGKASIDHSATADAMTFGGIDLATDFNIRIWGAGASCDHYTLTGAGFVDNGGHLSVTLVDGIEPDAGTSFTIGRIPSGSLVPSMLGSSWALSTKAVDGDDTVVDLVLSPAVSDYVFESSEYTDLCAADGWATGSVPTNQDVKVSGAATVATVSDAAAFPAFASIAVRNGATLRILANVVLPPLTVDATSKVIFGDGSSAVSATLDATLTTLCTVSGETVSLPVIEIATNATLTVAAGMKFKNVDFRLYGTVRKDGTDTRSPTFGYAENGETSYLAFTADGGNFDFHANNNSGDYGSVSIVYPAAGGTVVPVGTIVVRNSRRQVNGWADFGRWEFGCNNPTSVPIDVLIDGTALDCAAEFIASGAAHLSLVNGACIRRNGSCLGHYFSMAIRYAATVDVGSGCYVDFTANDGAFGIDVQSAVDAVKVRDGGLYTVSYNSDGYLRGVFASDGGVLGVGKIYGNRTRSDLLKGFGSARLDGDLAIQSVNIGTGDTNWDRHVKMSAIPFAGTGDVTVTNGVPSYPFTVTMVSSNNTATGAIKVARAEGDAETALYFADGANWAGTVVAGNVALTNLTDGAAAASVGFGSLDLAADFPIRVWSDGGTLANDVLNVGAYENHGGRLRPMMMSSSEGFVSGVGIEVGKIAKGSDLPATASGWVAKTVAIDGDDENDMLVLRLGSGIQIIVR